MAAYPRVKSASFSTGCKDISNLGRGGGGGAGAVICAFDFGPRGPWF